MKAFFAALVALVVISVAANQILVRMEASGNMNSTVSDNVRLN